MKQKIGIWGFGIVGKSAYHYLKTTGACLEILDQKPLSPADQAMLAAHAVSHYSQENLIDFLQRNDAILPGPGIDLRPYKEFHHKWISELDIFYAQYKKPIIAITGTIGKTSITHLLGQLLQKNNTDIIVGGNIGIGMLDLITQPSKEALLEVSSFQLELCRTFAPDLAIWTNFSTNHLDRHATTQEYFDAKMRILLHQKKHQQSLVPLSLAPELKKYTLHSSCSFFSITPPTHAELSDLITDQALYFIDNDSIVVYRNGIITPLLPTAHIPALSYTYNWLIIIAALHILDLPLESSMKHATTLTLPEHRLEKVATINDIDFYNDSKSTTPEATLAAVHQLSKKPIHILLGGMSKGIDREPLIKDLVDKVVCVYAFGKEAEQLHAFAQKHALPSSYFATLDAAFNTALTNARPHDQILFSPAGSSFDLFENYMQRGAYFKNLVETLANKSRKN